MQNHFLDRYDGGFLGGYFCSCFRCFSRGFDLLSSISIFFETNKKNNYVSENAPFLSYKVNTSLPDRKFSILTYLSIYGQKDLFVCCHFFHAILPTKNSYGNYFLNGYWGIFRRKRLLDGIPSI